VIVEAGLPFHSETRCLSKAGPFTVRIQPVHAIQPNTIKIFGSLLVT